MVGMAVVRVKRVTCPIAPGFGNDFWGLGQTFDVAQVGLPQNGPFPAQDPWAKIKPNCVWILPHMQYNPTTNCGFLFPLASLLF